MTGDTSRTLWRVMTWNVRGAARPDLAAVAAVIAEQRPDVIAMQEIRRGQASALAGLLQWQHVWTRKHSPFTPLVWWLAEGLAIMSPHPLGERAKQSLSPGVSTWTHRHRVVLAVTVQRGLSTLRVYDVHLASGRRPDERIAQSARVAGMIAAESPAAAVVVGDLNAPGEVEVIRPLHAVGLHDPGGGPTHPSVAPRSRLDYIVVPDHARVSDRYEPGGDQSWWPLSDHLPQALTLEL
jgi:endonuclease/exonuclease/phosphatase family metal-dependent hydrolase